MDTDLTLEQVKVIALRFPTKGEFLKVAPSAYHWAHRHGRVDEVCSHMTGRRKWDLEGLKAVALGFTTRKEFERGDSAAYQTAVQRGVLDDICGHMEIKRIEWTPERIVAEAKKYRSRSAFREANPNAYAAAIRARLQNQFLQIFPDAERGYGHHVVYRIDFPDATYIGLAADKDLRAQTHQTKGTVSKYLAATGYDLPPLQILHEHLSPQEAQHWEVYEIAAARSLGLQLLNKKAGGQLGGWGRVAWTKELVLERALKYATRSEFRSHDHAAQLAAKANGWLEEACAHMPEMRREFTLDDLRRIASHYSSRGDLLKGDPSVYNAVRSRGILADVCSHMAPRRKRNPSVGPQRAPIGARDQGGKS